MCFSMSLYTHFDGFSLHTVATVSFSESTYSIAENAGQMDITVVRGGDTARVAIVLLTTDESIGSAIGRLILSTLTVHSSIGICTIYS